MDSVRIYLHPLFLEKCFDATKYFVTIRRSNDRRIDLFISSMRRKSAHTHTHTCLRYNIFDDSKLFTFARVKNIRRWLNLIYSLRALSHFHFGKLFTTVGGARRSPLYIFCTHQLINVQFVPRTLSLSHLKSKVHVFIINIIEFIS